MAAIFGSAAGGSFTACGRSAVDAKFDGASGSAADGAGAIASGAASNGGAHASVGGAVARQAPGNAGGGAAGLSVEDGGAGGAPIEPAKNYAVTGSWPKRPVALEARQGQLKYEKLVIQDQFLAESCAIGDYDNDGVPDVSSGRIWYQGPDFKTQHPFRDGHGALPRTGAGPEIQTGMADDWADYALDMDGDGDTDIINCAQVAVDEVAYTPNKIGAVQPHATCYWYENPGVEGRAGDPNWPAHMLHADVRLEEHGLVDMNGDGFPEIYGACKSCMPNQTKGFYQANRESPTAPWTYHPVTDYVVFPWGGQGTMHGEGGGDVNGDGLPDLLERSGAWLQQPDGSFNSTPCTGKNTPEGCGFVKHNFYDGLEDSSGVKGGSHIYAVDMDLDGITDVVSADWAHGEGLAWYKQDASGQFTRYTFLQGAGESAAWGAGFSEPHALEVVDMDRDGRPDVVTGKMRLAHPYGYGDPDPDGTPVVYVFKNVAKLDGHTGAPITLQPVRVDPLVIPPASTLGKPEGGMGIGRQIAIGHVNTDGILDICVATKVGLAVFFGQ